MRNTCAINVGRLLEVRAEAGYRTRADVDTLFDAIDVELRKLPPKQHVIVVTDWRSCPIMSEEAAERLVQRVTRLNDRIDRSAAIASPNSPTTVLQFIRLIRESKHPGRRLFENETQMLTWLAEVLDPAEMDRCLEFLRESRGPRR